MHIATREIEGRPGHYAVVVLAPGGEVIATLQRPFKGEVEARRVVKVERARLDRPGKGVRL